MTLTPRPGILEVAPYVGGEAAISGQVLDILAEQRLAQRLAGLLTPGQEVAEALLVLGFGYRILSSQSVSKNAIKIILSKLCG